MRAWDAILVACVAFGGFAWALSDSAAEEATAASACAAFEVPLNRKDGADWQHYNPVGTLGKGLATTELPPDYVAIGEPEIRATSAVVVACRK